jgi:hypothetical protein
MQRVPAGETWQDHSGETDEAKKSPPSAGLASAHPTECRKELFGPGSRSNGHEIRVDDPVDTRNAIRPQLRVPSMVTALHVEHQPCFGLCFACHPSTEHLEEAELDPPVAADHACHLDQRQSFSGKTGERVGPQRRHERARIVCHLPACARETFCAPLSDGDRPSRKRLVIGIRRSLPNARTVMRTPGGD